ncbi:MAG TPA: hypothetical protein VJ749_12405 [Pyrinomonadaceae bacterium]|nr:hypothetical protein [Pyrinomonadaceae bacterium]
MLIRISPEAEAELTEAREWYSHQRDDLDLEFMQCVHDALSRIVENPLAFPLVIELCGALWSAVFRSLSFIKWELVKLK